MSISPSSYLKGFRCFFAAGTLAIALVIFLATVAMAGKQGQEPIHIEADRMVSDQQNNTVTFSGKVEARQGPLTIRAATMTVFHHTGSKDKNPKQQINKIHAQGKVEIVKGDLIATGKKLEYEAGTHQAQLMGDTKVWHNNNLVTGEQVLLDLTQNTTIIESGQKEGGRVKAFFYPEGDK